MTGVQTCALPICFPVTIGGIGIGFNLDRFIKIIVEGSNDFAVVKRLNWMIETMAIAIDTNTVIITNGSH